MNIPGLPEGMTDPDEIDRWLEARDARAGREAAGRDVLDDAVMAAVPWYRHNPDAATQPATVAAIQASRAYAALPFWQRWFTPRPPGWLPPVTGPIHH